MIKRLLHLFFPPFSVAHKPTLNEKQLAMIADLHAMTTAMVKAEESKPFWLAWAKKTSASGGEACEPDAAWADQIIVRDGFVEILNINGVRGQHKCHPLADAYPNYADLVALCRKCGGAA